MNTRATSFILCLLPAVLAAQEPPGTSAAPAPPDTVAARPLQAAGWLEREHLSGSWGGGRDSLARRGVEVVLTSVTDGSVGLSPDRSPLGALRALLTASMALDLGEALGWQGASALVQVQARPGGYRAALVGEVQGTTNIDAPSFAGLAEVWLEQRLGGTRWKGGWIDLSAEMGMLAPANEFLNPSFAVSPTQPGFPTFPDPRPGLIGELDGGGPALRLAAFAAEPGSRRPDFGLAELDVRRGSARAAAGVWQRRTRDGAPRHGLQVVTEVSREIAGGRQLAGFVRFGRTGPGLGVHQHLAAGLVGNVLGRPGDVAGAAWTQVALRAVGGRLTESILELFLAWRAAPWLELRPDLQLVRGDVGRGGIATLRVSISH